MEMPHRPFYPPVALSPDVFGLQRPSLLERAGESDGETQKRIAAVENGVVAAFGAAVEHLGEYEARQLFARVLRRPKRGQGKVLAPDRDVRLLQEYDAIARTGETVAALSKRLRANGVELGNTYGAIATQIRKLVKERDARRHAAALEARRWQMGPNEETSLLTSARSEK